MRELLLATSCYLHHVFCKYLEYLKYAISLIYVVISYSILLNLSGLMLENSDRIIELKIKNYVIPQYNRIVYLDIDYKFASSLSANCLSYSKIPWSEVFCA